MLDSCTDNLAIILFGGLSTTGLSQVSGQVPILGPIFLPQLRRRVCSGSLFGKESLCLSAVGLGSSVFRQTVLASRDCGCVGMR